MSVSTFRLPASAGPTPRRSRNWGNPATYFVALVFIAVSLAPVLYIVIGGFRTNSQITVDPAGLPAPWNIGNYLGVLEGGTFWQEVGNSTIAAACTTAGVVVLERTGTGRALTRSEPSAWMVVPVLAGIAVLLVL